MKPGDHSDALERIARDCNQSPLIVLELFLERAAIREYEGGFARAEAEQLALGDVQEALSLRQNAPARPADATGLQAQNDGRRQAIAPEGCANLAHSSTRGGAS